MKDNLVRYIYRILLRKGRFHKWEVKKVMKSSIYKKHFKRPMDFVLSLIAIIVLLPVLLAIGILIRIKLGSPVIFKQKRPGFNEKIFTLYKFRTMTDKRDGNDELLVDEIRRTKFGDFLRSTSLDELPELVNIIKGDMSIVGTRPLMIEYLPYYNEKERHRHDILPGLTGLAQINGRTASGWEKRFEYDLKYIENITFVGDVKIILETAGKVFRRDGNVAPSQQGDFHTYRIKQIEERK